jgi:hypothetical protein
MKDLWFRLKHSAILCYINLRAYRLKSMRSSRLRHMPLVWCRNGLYTLWAKKLDGHYCCDGIGCECGARTWRDYFKYNARYQLFGDSI